MALLRCLPSSSLTLQPSYNLSDALFISYTSDCECWLHRIDPASSFGERVTCVFLLDFLVHPPHYCCTTMGSYATCSNSSTLSIDFLLTVCTIFYSSTGVLMAGNCRRGPPSCGFLPKSTPLHVNRYLTQWLSLCHQLPPLVLMPGCLSVSQLYHRTTHPRFVSIIRRRIAIPCSSRRLFPTSPPPARR